MFQVILDYLLSNTTGPPLHCYSTQFSDHYCTQVYTAQVHAQVHAQTPV